MQRLSIVIVTRNSSRYLERCLETVVDRGDEIVVVDNASDDDSLELVRRRFPAVRVVELDHNLGYGPANNVGFEATASKHILVLNPDAWPVGSAIERLLEAAEEFPRAGLVGARLVRPDGAPEASARGFPTVWRLSTEYFFLRWLAPWTKSLNAFYGAGVDSRTPGEVEWVVGAAMLVRREAVEEVGGFDQSFFMYDEEVDLAYRLRERGWKVVYQPLATFVHVGGGSTNHHRLELYREQLRSHLRFLDKHRGRASAERGRTVIRRAMRLRGLVLRGERRRVSRDAARWLAEHDVGALLAGEQEESPRAVAPRTLR